MQVSVALEARNRGGKEDGWLSSWTKLFHRKYLNRTLIGIMTMFFQRT